MKRFVSFFALAVASCGDSSSSPSSVQSPPVVGQNETPAPTTSSSNTNDPPGNPTTNPVDPPPDASTKLDAMTALLALAPSCSDDKWCWRGPTPSGNDYSQIFSTSPDNIWIIGQHGTLLQWNGEAWIAHHPPVQEGQPPNQLPMTITGRNAKDMWIIYNATVQHWDGATWTVLDKLNTNGIIAFNQLWAAPDGNTWATLSTGALKRFPLDGSKAEIVNTNCNCFLGNLWGTSSSDFFITTIGAGILHYDGAKFESTSDGKHIAASYAGAKDDVWVAGADSTIMHWDGKAWTNMPTGLPKDNYYVSNTAYLASDDVWWWAQSSSAFSAFVHWDGKELKTTELDTHDIGGFLYSSRIIDGKWWLVGRGGRVYTKTVDGKLKPVIVPPIEGQVQDMWGSADSDMYFATGGELVHYDGKTYTTESRMIRAVQGIHGADGKNELFGGGFELTDDHLNYVALAWHFDGANWQKTQLDQSTVANQQYKYFEKVHALGPGEVLAVGYKGIAYRFTNGAWKRWRAASRPTS